MTLDDKISNLISLLGGTGQVAHHLKIKSSAISNWKKLNKIPKNKYNSLIELSNNLNIDINSFLNTNNSNTMNLKKNINVLLIICGGIAAYKSLEIIRLIKKTDIDLDIVMTKSAQEFITPLLVTSLNGKKCYVDLFSVEDESKMNHIHLARKPDVILISPATANIMAKLACGIADDLASTLLLATDSKIILAPSMNPIMWNNLATQANYKTLVSRGLHFVEPEKGDLACGESGTGRLAEPKLIFNTLLSHLKKNIVLNNNLDGVSVIVTAGPTIEDIDPVRFVSNKSSGKQGFSIASELADRGALVTLITGPVSIPFPKVNKIVHAKSAQEMFDNTFSELPATIIICAAAVADWKLIPELNNSTIVDNYNKIKKLKSNNSILTFKTIENPDILASVAQTKERPKLVIGFSAETENIINNAKQKLISKKIDLIIANDVSENKVFGSDYNKVFLIDKDNCEEWDSQDKKNIAFKLADKINNLLS